MTTPADGSERQGDPTASQTPATGNLFNPASPSLNQSSPAANPYAQQHSQQDFQQPYGDRQPYGGTASTKTNTLAIVSLVSSLVGFVVLFIGPIVGIIVGAVALSKIKKSRERGRGMAISGIVVGSVFLIFQILILITVIAIAAFFMTPEGIQFLEEYEQTYTR